MSYDRRKSGFSFIFILMLFVCLSAQEPRGSKIPSSSGSGVFKIGFLQSDPDQKFGFEWFNGLRNFMMEDLELRTSLKEEGFTGILLLPADDRDIIQRMNHDEFDLVFCSPYVYLFRAAQNYVGDVHDFYLNPHDACSARKD